MKSLEGRRPGREVLAGPPRGGAEMRRRTHTEPKGATLQSLGAGRQQRRMAGSDRPAGKARSRAACPGDKSSCARTENTLLVWPLLSRTELLKRLEFPK